jgi:hypothetical protein
MLCAPNRPNLGNNPSVDACRNNLSACFHRSILDN